MDGKEPCVEEPCARLVGRLRCPVNRVTEATCKAKPENGRASFFFLLNPRSFTIDSSDYSR